MDTSISPGLWKVIGNKNAWPFVVDGDGRAVAKADCSLSSGDWVNDTKQARANATAIAALPLLIAACQKVHCTGERKWDELSPEERSMVLDAKAALSAAGQPVPAERIREAYRAVNGPVKTVAVVVAKPPVLYAVSNDGGKTGVAWRTDALEALEYLDLQNKGGHTDYCVVAVRTGAGA